MGGKVIYYCLISNCETFDQMPRNSRGPQSDRLKNHCFRENKLETSTVKKKKSVSDFGTGPSLFLHVLSNLHRINECKQLTSFTYL